eukprot:gene885-42542_t
MIRELQSDHGVSLHVPRTGRDGEGDNAWVEGPR